MQNDQTWILIVIIAVVGIIALYMGHRLEMKAKRQDRVARNSNLNEIVQSSLVGYLRIEIDENGQIVRSEPSTVDSSSHDEMGGNYIPQKSLHAQLGEEGRKTIKSLMGPSWVKGMRGPRGRIISESQFEALRDDEKEYYRRKHDAKVEAKAADDFLRDAGNPI